ncbi:uncharacterized protein [Miscanthus floridulus]|uniref:uncharacterized protein n=1 Tax=Miscanthus floridulus TaxID=154761 RepID=UPI00345AB92D
MVLQQQYRNNKYMKYCDLINVLLATEARNELLMKNFHMRPARTQAHPEAHASFHSSNGKGSFRNKGQKFHGHSGQKGKKFKNRGQKSNGKGKGQKFNGNGKGKSLKGSKDEASGGKHSNESCFRYGSHQHWSPMDIDHNATGDHTAEKGDAYTGDDDFDLDNEDLLDEE